MAHWRLNTANRLPVFAGMQSSRTKKLKNGKLCSAHNSSRAWSTNRAWLNQSFDETSTKTRESSTETRHCCHTGMTLLHNFKLHLLYYVRHTHTLHRESARVASSAWLFLYLKIFQSVFPSDCLFHKSVSCCGEERTMSVGIVWEMRGTAAINTACPGRGGRGRVFGPSQN